MSRFLLLLLAVCLSAVIATTAAGCISTAQPLLSGLRLSPEVVEPSGSGDTAAARVYYSLSRPATMSAYIPLPSGEKSYLRKDEARPVAGYYQFAFDGSYAPDLAQPGRRVLPSGAYQLVVEARDAVGVAAQMAAPVEIRAADTDAPAIEHLVVSPEGISPNFDGIDDVAAISYRTTKEATASLYILSSTGKRYLLEREEHRPAGEHATTWNGQIGNQLLPDGSYRLLVEAQDAAGNVATEERALTIDHSAMPDARILSVSFDPQQLLLGGTVKVEMRVKNTGNTVLRTLGPDPGFTYGGQESFGSIQGGAYGEQRGYWRVGVDWTEQPGPASPRYPYRWGLGKDLQPNEETTVVGYLRIDQRYPRIWLYAGLVQEGVRFWDSEAGRTAIEIIY